MTTAALVLFAGTATAEPLEGLWRTQPGDDGNSGIIRIAPCGAALCGTLYRAFDPSGAEVAAPTLGSLIIWDTVPAGAGEYRGRIYAPDRDQTYNSRLVLAGDQLAVSGCVLGICRNGGTWTRAD